MVQADPEVSVKLSELPQNVEVLDGLPGPLRDVLLCAASETWAREVSVEGSEGCCRLTIEGRVCLNLRMVLFDRVEAVVEAHGSQPWTRVLAKLPTAESLLGSTETAVQRCSTLGWLGPSARHAERIGFAIEKYENQLPGEADPFLDQLKRTIGR